MITDPYTHHPFQTMLFLISMAFVVVSSLGSLSTRFNQSRSLSSVRQRACGASLTPVQRKKVLQFHNDLRSSIANGIHLVKGLKMPSANNMRRLVIVFRRIPSYDCSLEASAQEWAETCQLKHSSGVYGENLYMEYFKDGVTKVNTTDVVEGASQAWADEFNRFGSPSLVFTPKIFALGVGHATQMAWATTCRVGCAIALCNQGSKVIVVCHYWPHGNIINTSFYEEGPTCSDCPEELICDNSSGLCV